MKSANVQELHQHAGNGSLQEYLPISSDVPLTRKPSDLSWEQAAALPLVYITVYGCLVQRTGLPFEPTSPRTSQLSALILGGTSATGSVAIQLAKKMGLRVTTTCSGSSKSIVEKIGADEVSPRIGPGVDSPLTHR